VRVRAMQRPRSPGDTEERRRGRTVAAGFGGDGGHNRIWFSFRVVVVSPSGGGKSRRRVHGLGL
jgi:hypothetical protein